MCCSIYLLQNIYSLLTVFCPVLRQKIKTPYLQGTLVPQEMFYTFPELAGWCLRVWSALQPCHLLQWFPRTTGTKHTPLLPSGQLRDEVRHGLHSVVIHYIVHSCIYYI